jgi:polysaccharide export outer membrane protein
LASCIAAVLGVGALGCTTPVHFLGGDSDSSGVVGKAAAGDSNTSSVTTAVRGKDDSARDDEYLPSAYRIGPASTSHAGEDESDGTPAKPALPETSGEPNPPPPPPPLPHELAKATLPSYVIEPPDILFLDAIRIIPKPPYRIEPLDVLVIQVAEALPNQPIGAAPYPVSPDGTVNLGFSYGQVRVAGLTLEQAAQNIQQHLRRTLNNPQVAVALAQFRGIQQTRGEHLVQMDGTISLGSYGCVHVTGLTLSQARCVIEKHLSQWLLNPEVSLSVSAFNSKVYYIIIDGGGYGQQVFRLPITGNDTVLDAISQINGLPPISSTRKIWVARPTPANNACYEILPVNWRVITQAGDTATNYQLFPGDRIYVRANCLLGINNRISQFLYPLNNAMGSTLLGVGTWNLFRIAGRNNNNGF